MELKEVILRCYVCRGQKPYILTTLQVGKLAQGDKLTFHCPSCGCPQFWILAEPLKSSQSIAAVGIEPRAILIVDDDDLTLKLLRKVLGSWDARIEVARDGQEALTKLASGTFDLAILDVNMPGMSGQQLLDQIRDNALLPMQRIIFLTGDKSTRVKKFLDSSGCHFLYKPIQFLDFSDYVQEVLSGDEQS